VEAGFDGRIDRLSGVDTFIPLGAAADLVLVQDDGIEAAALALVASLHH
jgi:2-oxoisovalerate dehydrogenase E1 component